MCWVINEHCFLDFLSFGKSATLTTLFSSGLISEMSGESDAAAMGNRVPCSTTSPVPAQSQMGQQMRVNYRPVSLGEANQGTDSGQRKRGRPKKDSGQQLRGDASDSPADKKPRGKPPVSSSKKKGIEALGVGLGIYTINNGIYLDTVSFFLFIYLNFHFRVSLLLLAGSSGSGFRPHVITVESGEVEDSIHVQLHVISMRLEINAC